MLLLLLLLPLHQRYLRELSHQYCRFQDSSLGQCWALRLCMASHQCHLWKGPHHHHCHHHCPVVPSRQPAQLLSRCFRWAPPDLRQPRQNLERPSSAEDCGWHDHPPLRKQPPQRMCDRAAQLQQISQPPKWQLLLPLPLRLWRQMRLLSSLEVLRGCTSPPYDQRLRTSKGVNHDSHETLTPSMFATRSRRRTLNSGSDSTRGSLPLPAENAPVVKL